MTLRNLISVCTPRTQLILITRTRYASITCGNDIRTLRTLHLLGKEITRINPVGKYKIEVTVDEDSPNR